MRIVVKFGGTSLATAERIDRAARSIAETATGGHEVYVVASAMGDRTDELLEVIPDRVSDTARDDILSMGERTSVRLLAAALSAEGIPATYLEPGADGWPIHASGRGELDLERTATAVAELPGATDETIPIVAGFIAEGPDGSITTLGRGSSDTTAVALGSFLPADEVIIVTDVTGVMTADPHTVDSARNVHAIDADRLRELSVRGADVVSPDALALKDDDLSMRIVHYQQRDLLSGGTVIEGAFSSVVDLREGPIVAITLAGRGLRSRPGIVQSLSGRLDRGDVPIVAIASGLDSLTFYVDQARAGEAESALHDAVLDSEYLWSVSRSDPLGIVRITGHDLGDDPGRLIAALDALAEVHVEPTDVITSATTMALVVPWPNAEAALEAIQSMW